MSDTTDTDDVVHALRAYAKREWGIGSRVPHLMDEAADALETRQKEIERLTKCLEGANAQAEHFEREMYLREEELERIFDWL